MIFLDLDGPVLECRQRHYACYLDLCDRYGVRPLSHDAYWERRRARTSAAALLREGGARADAQTLRRQWIERIEQPRYLRLDTCQPQAAQTLAGWNEEGRRIVLVTLRRDEGAARAQLERLGLARFFERIVICDPELGGAGKAAAARDNAPGVEASASTWIGDTEVDATAAAALGCRKLYLLTCGIRNERELRSLGTGTIVDDLAAVSSCERAAGRPL